MFYAAILAMAASDHGLQQRDVLAIGASAGGVEALPRLLSVLPQTLQASVFVVLHQGREHPHLARILQRATTLPVEWAEQGARFQRGRVYVAPPDVHLALTDHHLRLVRGPRENFARPSIDRLFRSAAAELGTRVIGVLLTGTMDDGVAGLLAIRDAGGRTIVQDPQDASFPELPSRALALFTPDAALKLEAMGSAIVEMLGERVPPAAAPLPVVTEHEMDRSGWVSRSEMEQLGPQSVEICPDCGGPLWEIGRSGMRRWRCSLGHVTGARELLRSSEEKLEAALWNAVRALHERATTWETLSRDAVEAGTAHIADDYAIRGRETREQAELARKLMLDLLRRNR